MIAAGTVNKFSAPTGPIAGTIFASQVESPGEINPPCIPSSIATPCSIVSRYERETASNGSSQCLAWISRKIGFCSRAKHSFVGLQSDRCRHAFDVWTALPIRVEGSLRGTVTMLLVAANRWIVSRKQYKNNIAVPAGSVNTNIDDESCSRALPEFR